MLSPLPVNLVFLYETVNNCSFRYASPYLCNELPKGLRQFVDHQSLSLSFHLTPVHRLLHHRHHHPSLLSSAPISKLTFSINPSYHINLPYLLE